MLIPGLVSITFRQKTPLEICRLCESAQLQAIEWGGDVHVPPNARNIREIRDMSADHGLTVCSYGSYYRVTQPIDELRACIAPIVAAIGGEGDGLIILPIDSELGHSSV